MLSLLGVGVGVALLAIAMRIGLIDRAVNAIVNWIVDTAVDEAD